MAIVSNFNPRRRSPISLERDCDGYTLEKMVAI